MTRSIPIIYTPKTSGAKLSFAGRVAAMAITLGCCIILIVAARLTPDPTGVGTHTETGMQRCQFLYRTGVPCLTCGMTTSFAYFVRGNLLASLYVQPMGMLLALLTAATFWVSLYCAVTGKPAYRLLGLVRTRYYLWPVMFIAVAAWAWKIFIHLRGIDGWH